MFHTEHDRTTAEAVLRGGTAASNWQATGLALVVDAVRDLTDVVSNDLPGMIREAVAEALAQREAGDK